MNSSQEPDHGEGASRPDSAESQDCLQCEADLAAFIDAERREPLEAYRSYRHVWDHLQTCEICRELYRMICETLDDSAIFPPSGATKNRRAADWTRQSILIVVARDEIRWSLPPDIVRGAVRRSLGDEREEWFEIVSPTMSLNDRFAVSVDVQPGPDDCWILGVTLNPPPTGEIAVAMGQYTAREALVNGSASIVIPDRDFNNDETDPLRIALIEY
jgi:hypothetical protein